ncbi:MAG: DUF4132 domain-containing protein, partial [bacterium]|nr:DUF4132 domain-containing protein [bacterium]
EEAFSGFAKERGVSEEELLDIIIPDFDFSGRFREFDFSGKIYKGFIDNDLAFKFMSEEGKVIKSVPAAASDAEKQLIKTLKKEITDAKKQQKATIEQNLVTQRKWNKIKWENIFLNNPLMHAFGKGLVWGIYFEGKLLETFHISEQITFVNSSGNPIKLQDKNWESDFWNFLGMHQPKPYDMRKEKSIPEIGLVHPIDCTEEQIAAWTEIFTEKKVSQPVRQLGRKVFAKDEEEKTKKFNWMFEKKTIAKFAFDRLGWRRGSVVDAGGVSGYRKIFPHAGIEVFVEVEDVGVQFYGDMSGSLKQFYFVPAGSIHTGSYYYDEPGDEEDSRLIKIDDVPDIVYSETVLDLSIIAGEAEG